MFLAEPPPTQGDLHFRLFDIPIRVHPFFWLVILVLGIRLQPKEIFVWILAAFVSVVVHEMGHAFLQRKYGGNPRIVLYAMGGMAISERCDRSTKAQIIISLAGPCAGFLLAALLIITIRVVGHHIAMEFPGAFVFSTGPAAAMSGVPLPFVSLYWESFTSPEVNHMIFVLLLFNILWGLVNLMPIYPLDGGRVSREICLLGNPRRGMILSLQISVAAAIFMVIVGLSWGSFFVAIFFGFLAYSSYKTLQDYQASAW